MEAGKFLFATCFADLSCFRHVRFTQQVFSSKSRSLLIMPDYQYYYRP